MHIKRKRDGFLPSDSSKNSTAFPLFQSITGRISKTYHSIGKMSITGRIS